jgi:hypothetical protein
MKTHIASPEIRAAIHSIIVGQMASSLILTAPDLSNHDDCRRVLLEVGFGDRSVNLLLARSIAAAQGAVAATKET